MNRLLDNRQTRGGNADQNRSVTSDNRHTDRREGRKRQLEMLQSERDSNDGQRQSRREGEMHKRQMPPRKNQPDNIPNNSQHARPDIIPTGHRPAIHKPAAEGPARERPQHETRAGPRKTNDGNRHQNAHQVPPNAGNRASQQKPKQISERPHAKNITQGLQKSMYTGNSAAISRFPCAPI
jgi:hypothetical protein